MDNYSSREAEIMDIVYDLMDIVYDKQNQTSMCLDSHLN